MDIDIHSVSKITLEPIRKLDGYTTRTIVIESKDGSVEINLYSVRNDDNESTLEIRA